MAAAPESRYAQAMRLAAHRLETHAERTLTTADALEQPSGFGREFDAIRWREAKALRRDAGEDQVRADELRALREHV